MAHKGYIVYKTDDGEIVKIVGDQSTANTTADADSALSASEEVDVPENIRPGDYFNSGDGTFANEDVDTSDEATLKAAARGCHAQLLVWARALAEEGVGHPSTDVALGHDFLFRGHQALYIIMNRDTYTVSQKATYCQMVARGALDITSPFTFFQKVHTLTTPNIPIAWVNPSTGARVNLSESVTLSGPGTGNLNLLESDIPDTIHLTGGEWIDDLTA